MVHGFETHVCLHLSFPPARLRRYFGGQAGMTYRLCFSSIISVMHSDFSWFLVILAIIGVFAYSSWSNEQGGGFLRYATSTPVAVETRAAETAVPAPRTQAASEEVAELTAPDPNIAPLLGKVTISSVSRGTDPQREYVRLQAARQNTEPVLITGLVLRSAAAGGSVKIPKAWRLPFPGAAGDGEAVTLSPGGAAYIVTGYSGNGMSFQLNSCTGYFTQAKNFSPAIPRSCPRPIHDPLPLPPNQLSERCYDFLASLPSCTVPSIPLRLAEDGSCQAHIVRNINYNGCVSLHKNDQNFYRNDWRIYLGRNGVLWRERRELIELLDEKGRLIDSYNY